MTLFKKIFTSIQMNLPNLMSGKFMYSFCTKSICCMVMLLLYGNSLFSQAPEVEHRIINLRYEPVWPSTANGAIVFDIQLRAGVNYIETKYPMLTANIIVHYYLEPGVTISVSAGYGMPAFPNPYRISMITPLPWIPAGPNAINLSMSKDISPALPNLYNFTYEFATIGTIVLPVLAGTPTPASSIVFTTFDNTPFTSSWGSGHFPGVRFPFTPACPNEVHIGVDYHAFFDYPVDYCIGDPEPVLTSPSENGIPGYWVLGADPGDPPVSTISTATLGKYTYTYFPSALDICEETIIVLVHDLYEIEVDDIDDVCGGAPFDLMDAVTVGADEKPANYHFYTHDGTDYVPVLPPTGLVLTVPGAHEYFVRYIPVMEEGDEYLCPSEFVRFEVNINAPDQAIVDATCVNGVIKAIEVLHPHNPDYEYSVDGIIWQGDPAYIFTGLDNTEYTVYVRNANDGCYSTVEVECPPCPDYPEITLNAGNPTICVGTGNYIATGTFVNATAVLVTSDGYGSYTPGSFTTSPMSVAYTPSVYDAGNIVTLTFKIDATATCPEVTETISFEVLSAPLPPMIENTYQEFCEFATVADLKADGVGIQWYDVPTGGTALSGSTPLVHDGIYYATQTFANGCESALRSAVTVGIVDPSELLPPSIEDQILCNGAQVSDIVTDGSLGIVIFDPSETELNPTDYLIIGGTYKAIYRYGTGVNLCESTSFTEFEITLTSGKADDPAIDDQSFCFGATIANIVVPNDNIIWYYDNFGTPALSQSTELENGIHTYYAQQSIGGACEASDLVPVVITVGGTIPPPITYEPYMFCIGATLGNINVSGYGVTWYQFMNSTTALPHGTVIPLGVNTYYVGQTGSATCYTNPDERAEVEVTVLDCNNLIDCSLMIDRVEDEDFIGACEYTHQDNTWDAVPVISSVPLNIQYFVEGTLVGATLNGVKFPLGVSHVKAVATYGKFVDSCEFTVTINPLCPSVSDADGDGNFYPVYSVAGLCWTSNLFTTSYMNTDPIEFAKGYVYDPDYPDEDASIAIFGRLYTWYSAVGVDEGDNTQLPLDCQGICPDGWRLPTVAELNGLNSLDANGLKSNSPAHWVIPGTDDVPCKFDARGAGKYDSGIDRFVDMRGFFGLWACDATTGALAPYFNFTYFCDKTEKDVIYKTDALSIRCVQDRTCP